MNTEFRIITVNKIRYRHDASTNTYAIQDSRGRWVRTNPPQLEDDSDEEDDDDENDDEDDDEENDDDDDDDDESDGPDDEVEGGVAANEDESSSGEEEEDDDDNEDQAPPATLPVTANAIIERMQQLQVQNQSRLGTGGKQPPDLINVPSIPDLHLAFDERTGVRSVQQYGPSEQITQPELFKQGVGAYALLKEIPGSPDSEFDPAYRKRERPSRFFVVGKVFSLLWAEPAGDSRQTSISNREPSLVSAGYTTGVLGQRVFQKIRRFIVIIAGQNSCTAVPILTHDGRGAAARGANKSEYGIVYIGSRPPQPSPGEVGMVPFSVRINPDNKFEVLDRMSRINYGKLYTIEHNLKVKPLGMVHDDSRMPFFAQVKTMMLNRIGQSTKGVQQTAHAGPSTQAVPVYPAQTQGYSQGRGQSAGYSQTYTTGSNVAYQPTRQANTQSYTYSSSPPPSSARGSFSNSAAPVGLMQPRATMPQQTGASQSDPNTDPRFARRIILERLLAAGWSNEDAMAKIDEMVAERNQAARSQQR